VNIFKYILILFLLLCLGGINTLEAQLLPQGFTLPELSNDTTIANISISDSFKNDKLSASLYVSHSELRKGSNFQIALLLNINEIWHINAHILDDEFLIPTEVEFHSDDIGISFGRVMYPIALEKTFDFSDESLKLYDGEIIIGADATVLDVPVGDYILTAIVNYQACDAQQCINNVQHQMNSS